MAKGCIFGRKPDACVSLICWWPDCQPNDPERRSESIKAAIVAHVAKCYARDDPGYAERVQRGEVDRMRWNIRRIRKPRAPETARMLGDRWVMLGKHRFVRA